MTQRTAQTKQGMSDTDTGTTPKTGADMVQSEIGGQTDNDSTGATTDAAITGQ